MKHSDVEFWYTGRTFWRRFGSCMNGFFLLAITTNCRKNSIQTTLYAAHLLPRDWLIDYLISYNFISAAFEISCPSLLPQHIHVEKWSTEDKFVIHLSGREGLYRFHRLQWRNNYQPSCEHRSNTVHHCTLRRRSLLINIKPIWAEKLQCPNDVYTSALMSLLSDIAALPTVFPSPSLHRKD